MDQSTIRNVRIQIEEKTCRRGCICHTTTSTILVPSSVVGYYRLKYLEIKRIKVELKNVRIQIDKDIRMSHDGSFHLIKEGSVVSMYGISFQR